MSSAHNGGEPGRPVAGVIVRRIPLRLVDVSVGGCLVESAHVLREGTVGTVELTIDGQRFIETIRVCRSTKVTGSVWPCRAGAHFLTLAAPSPASLRNLAARLEVLDERGLMAPARTTSGLRPLAGTEMAAEGWAVGGAERDVTPEEEVG